jgi:hypothetical protein
VISGLRPLRRFAEVPQLSLRAALASLPAVAASVSPPQTSLLGGSVSEYAVTRVKPDGTQQLFLIYFVRDPDGIWRLDTM